MRYQENNLVADVLAWLEEQSCGITEQGYHRFMTRVLRRLPVAQARELGVDLALLRAVRVRYKFPVDPKGGGAITAKRRPPHNVRAHRRRIVPRPPEPLPARRPRHPARDVEQKSADVPRPLPVEPAPGLPALRGTLDNPHNSDWILINDMALEKLYAKDKLIMINDVGEVIHIKTRREYTPEQLVEQFGLHKSEAESCFMTFTERRK